MSCPHCKDKPDTRSLQQNRLLHGILGDIAKQVEWHGQKMNATVWKRLTTAAMLRENGSSPLLVPSLDGAGIDVIYEKTSKMSVKTVTMLIEWCRFFGDSHQVMWSDLRRDEY